MSGRPLLPHDSLGCADAKKVDAPRCARPSLGHAGYIVGVVVVVEGSSSS